MRGTLTTPAVVCDVWKPSAFERKKKENRPALASRTARWAKMVPCRWGVSICLALIVDLGISDYCVMLLRFEVWNVVRVLGGMDGVKELVVGLLCSSYYRHLYKHQSRQLPRLVEDMPANMFSSAINRQSVQEGYWRNPVVAQICHNCNATG